MRTKHQISTLKTLPLPLVTQVHKIVQTSSLQPKYRAQIVLLPLQYRSDQVETVTTCAASAQSRKMQAQPL